MKLEIKELEVELQSSQILRGISLEVNAQELVCLVGRNGAGKSTTLRSVMGYISPSAGAIDLDETSLIGKSTEDIARLGLGFSPEESEVFTSLSVAQNIELPTWTKPSERSGADRIALAYEIFPKLREYQARGGGQLSGGERKMLSIARALSLDADVFLLDEPFEGLSPAITPSIKEAIHRIVKLGRAVLQAESNLHHVPDFADRLYVIERGEIIFVGTPAEAYRDADVMRIIGGEI